MKALLPVYCRPLGYVVLLVALFIPFILVMQGVVMILTCCFIKNVQSCDDGRMLVNNLCIE